MTIIKPKELIKVTSIITENLNKVIDLNYYPVPETAIDPVR